MNLFGRRRLGAGKRRDCKGTERRCWRCSGRFGQLCWCWPKAFGAGETILSEDAQTKVVRNGNGRIARFWKHRSGTPEHLGFECESRRTWEERFKPAMLANWMQVNVEKAAAHFREARGGGNGRIWRGWRALEQTRQIMGDEVTLMAMIEEPEW